jgi:glutamate/tyrosine decarboxylase-like PLP-dependent enzyme
MMKPPEVSHFRGLQALAQFRQRILYFRRHFGIDLTSLFASIRQLLEDVARADSLVWDAHKWLFQTYACSMVLFRDRKHLAAFYSSDPEYLRDAAAENGEINYWEWGIELTRPAHSLKLWLTLQTLVTDQISDMVTHGIGLAQQTESMLRNQPEWEVVTPTQLAIVKFCYAPQGITPQQQDELFLGA